jgi:hypothetical protein
MTTDDKAEDGGAETIDGELPVAAGRLMPAVVRSTVAPVKNYSEYRRTLRRDFLYSCAYCTMSEHEAHGISFAIDHYEPQTARDDLINAYENLMYSCEVCNARKGDRYPPPAAREDGKRFFRADEDIRREHFQLVGSRLEGTTPLGRYTEDAVDLNRDGLLKLRQLRRQLIDHNEYVAEGIAALLSFPVDRIGQPFRLQVLKLINEAVKAAEDAFDDLDALLLEFAKSAVLPDEEPADEELLRKTERLSRLRTEETMYPGLWRGRRKKKKSH